MSVPLGVATVGVLLLMRLYSPWLKRAGFAGNLVVSVLASLPFLYGSYAAGDWQSGVPLVLLAIPLHLARELAKDLDDREADRGTRRTIPVTAGVHSARAAIVAALVAGALAFGLGVAPQVKSLTLLFAARGAGRRRARARHHARAPWASGESRVLQAGHGVRDGGAPRRSRMNVSLTIRK